MLESSKDSSLVAEGPVVADADWVAGGTSDAADSTGEDTLRESSGGSGLNVGGEWGVGFKEGSGLRLKGGIRPELNEAGRLEVTGHTVGAVLTARDSVYLESETDCRSSCSN